MTTAVSLNLTSAVWQSQEEDASSRKWFSLSNECMV